MTVTNLNPPTFHAWMDGAACKRSQNDPDWWFSTDTTVISHAKRICNIECEVRQRCLKWATDTRHPHGIAGGLTPRERRVDKNA